MKPVLMAGTIASSLRERALGPRDSQAWKPDLETPSASHSHATGQTERCFTIKPNFISTPSRSRPRPFLGCRAPPSACELRGENAQSPNVRASSAHAQERLEPDRRKKPSPNCGARFRGGPGPEPPELR